MSSVHSGKHHKNHCYHSNINVTKVSITAGTSLQGERTDQSIFSRYPKHTRCLLSNILTMMLIPQDTPIYLYSLWVVDRYMQHLVLTSVSILTCYVMSNHVSTYHNLYQQVSSCRNMSQHASTCSNLSQHVPTFSILSQHVLTCPNTCQHLTTFLKMSQHVWECQNFSQHFLESLDTF